MRKSKGIILSALMAGCMMSLTACGKMEEPTEDDVLEALVKEDIIEEDAEDDFTVSIDKVSLDEEDEEAKVTCSVVGKKGSIEVTNEYRIKFKYKDDKSWKAKDVELRDSKSELVEGISDERAQELIESLYVSVDGTGMNMDDEGVSYELDSHEEDLEENKDVVTFKCEASKGIYDFTFDLKVTYNHYSYDNESSWSYSFYEVENVEKEYVDGYEFKLSEKDVAAGLKTEDLHSLSIMGNSFDFDDEEAEITVEELGEFKADDYNEKYGTVPVTFTYKYKDVSVQISAIVKFEYDTDEGWGFDAIGQYEILNFTCGMAGNYTGTITEGDVKSTFKMTISDVYDADAYGMPAEVIVTSPTGKTYSYSATLESYKISDDKCEFAIYDKDWIAEPTEDPYTKISFYGYYKDGVITTQYATDIWTMQKQK